ncbi:MAG: OsmC family protein [Candidatus Omnitrophica bacterium]|nr:OsmC family protein [Candidatus Omnitrophota bacterium]
MSEIKVKSKQFIYKNFIKWQGQKKGLLTSSDKPNIEVATPPEFQGHPGVWTPEDLFVASVNSCIMTTFLYYIDKEGIEFLSYECESEGILERVDNQFVISKIKIKPKITVKKDADIQKIKDLIELTEKNCLISNSIKSKVKVTPRIEVQE